MGADDYITKPIDFDVLATIIMARLARIARMGFGQSRSHPTTGR